jgi:hypothetical protein
MTACDIGDALDHAVAGTINQEDLANDAGRRARHECRKRRHGRPFDPVGGNDDA